MLGDGLPDREDMYTQCPKCEAVFAIAQEQLEHREGVVRCGACMGVFNATTHLFDQIPDDPEDTISTIDLVATEGGGLAGHEGPAGREGLAGNEGLAGRSGLAGQRSAALTDIDVDDDDSVDAALGYQPDELIGQVESELGQFDVEKTGDLPVEQIELETPQWDQLGDQLGDQLSTESSLSADGDTPGFYSSGNTSPVVDDEERVSAPYSVAGLAASMAPDASIFGSSAARVADHDPNSVSVEEINDLETEFLPDEPIIPDPPAAEPSSPNSPMGHASESLESLIEVDPSLPQRKADPSTNLASRTDGISLGDEALSGLDSGDVSLSIHDTGKTDEVVLSLDVYEEEQDANSISVAEAAQMLNVGNDTRTRSADSQGQQPSQEPQDRFEQTQDHVDLEASIDAAFAPDDSTHLSSDTDVSDISSFADVDDLDDAAASHTTRKTRPPELFAPDQLQRDEPAEPVLSAAKPIAASAPTQPSALDEAYASLEDNQATDVAPLSVKDRSDFGDDVEFDDDAFLSRTGMDFDADVDSELVSEIEFVAKLERAGEDLDFDSDEFIQSHHASKVAKADQAADNDTSGTVLDPIAAAKQRGATSIPSLSTPDTFGIPAPKVPAWKTWGLRGVLGIGCLGLVATLLWQVKAFYLDDLAQVPSLRPALTTLCDVAGCEVPPRRSPGDMSLIATYIDSHPQIPNALRIATQITNSAVFPQPFPNVRLTMTDKRGRIVQRKGYTPKEYLAVQSDKQVLIEPGKTEQVFFDLVDPSENVFGYEVELLAAD